MRLMRGRGTKWAGGCVLAALPACACYCGGEKALAQVVAQNSGIAEISGTLSTADFARPEHFTLSTLPNFAGSVPIAIPPRADVELDLEYRPLEIGQDNGRIAINLCGEDCGIEVL